LLGSVSLIGGHGTTIAWAPVIAARFGLPNALEIGIASATLGLVVESLLGGPLAGLLIFRFKLSGQGAAEPVIGRHGDTEHPGAQPRIFVRARVL
jgi:ESS family glutamate:Na+ symporter